MKALRFLRALPLVLMFGGAARADQGTIVGPTVGPKSMTEVMTTLNAALLAIQSCNSGPSAPANGPGPAAKAFQCWADTSAAPVVGYKTYDGVSWVTFGQLNTSTHVWTPYRNGAPIAAVATSSSAADLTTGTLPAARLPVPTVSTLGGVQAKTCSASQWLNEITTLGVPNCVQPNFTDIAGVAALAQLPAFSGMSAAAAAADADTFPTNQGAGNLKQTLAAVKTWIKAWIVKADVGLGNVDNTSDATKWSATKTLLNTTFNCGSTGNVCAVRLASDITGFGTGIATALGVNIGSAGAPVLFNGAGGTPSSMVGTNITGTAPGLTAGNVSTNANLTGEVTSVGNATTVTNASVIAKVLTSFASSAGTVSSSDSILTAFQKIVGNIALKANAANPVLTGLLDVQGAVKFSSQATPAQITANQNDYNPSSVNCATATTLVLTSDAARSITGLAGGVAGCEMRVINAGSFTISLLEQSGSSTAANRFNFSGILTLASGQAANVVYDGVNSRWRQIGGPSSSGGGSGTMTQVICGNQTITTSGTCQTDSGLGIQNCSIGASVASNLLTINLLDAGGSTPSSTSPCRINFRSTTAASGVVTSNYTTGAASISTFATGATLGSASAAAFRFWVVAFDNAGTTVLGLINCSTPSQIFPLDEAAVASSTAISGSATAAGTFYTPNGAALTSKAFRILGYIEYGASGLTTAGTYASAPSIVQLFGPGIKKPGDVVQPVFANFGSQNSTTSNSYTDSGLTASITLRSAANLVRSEFSSIVVIGTPGEIITTMIHQDGAPIGSTAQYSTTASGFNYTSVSGLAFNRPNKTTAASYVVRFKNSSNSNAVYFGNSAGSTMALSEIMG